MGMHRNASPGSREQWAANADVTISSTLWATHETRTMGTKGPSAGEADKVRLLIWLHRPPRSPSVTAGQRPSSDNRLWERARDTEVTASHEESNSRITSGPNPQGSGACSTGREAHNTLHTEQRHGPNATAQTSRETKGVTW